MAKIIETKVQSRKVTNYYPFFMIAFAGVFLGLLQWLFALIISQFTKSATIPGDVSTILVATIGVIILVKLELRQPLLIVVAVAASLWGLTGLLNGLSVVEAVIWSGILYGMAYVLFSWLARYKQTIPVLILIIVIIFIVRLISLA